jgi:Bacterial Ig-like domain (group 3)/Beta-propeller repeat
VDSAGNAYIAGGTSSPNFPTTNPMQAVNNGYSNVYVTQLNASGTAWTFSTYMGGSNYDTATGIAVDSAGNTYVVGATDSTNFPVENPLQADNNGGFDAFVAKIGAGTATTTTLSSSLNPSNHGQAVTFTAVVTSSNGAPPNGETVTFMRGKTVLGTGALNAGSASFTISTLPVGTISITAAFSGDSNFAGSTSKPVKQVVNKP